MGISSLPAITWPLMLIVVLEATSFLTVLVANMEIWMFSVGDGTAQDEKLGIDMSYAYGLIVSSSPIVTAFLADNFFGRYTLVTVHSVLIVAGYILFMTSTYMIQSAFWFVLAGMTLNAIGEGINRTIFPTYCADQVMSRGGDSGEKMISLYYAFLQMGGILIVCTDLSKDLVKCDGKPCFKLMFGIGLCASVLALLVHLATTKWIHKQKVSNNILVDSVKCIFFAITNISEYSENESSKSEEECEPTGTIMDRAIPQFGAKFVGDVTQALRVCRMFFIGIPYYACYFGVFGIFVGQFLRVNAQIGSFTLTPILYLTINPLTITISVFVIKWLTNVLSEYLTITHLMKIAIGGLVTSLAYGLVLMVELKIQDDTLPVLSKLEGNLVMYNHPSTNECQFQLNNQNNLNITKISKELNVYNKLSTGNYTFSVECPVTINSNSSYRNSWIIEIKPQNANVVFTSRSPNLMSIQIQTVSRPVHRLKSGQTEVIVFGCQKKPKIEMFEYFAWQTLDQTVKYGSQRSMNISVKGESGGTILYFDKTDCSEYSKIENVKHILIAPYGISILWMIPQLMLMALVEALLTVSANEFAYSQTMHSMRSFIQALWLLTSAIGSLFGLVLNQFELAVTTKCIVYSLAMLFTTALFAVASRTYTYVEISPEKKDGSSSRSEE